MKFISFDLETTGFLPGVDNIVEIGAICWEHGHPVGKFSTLIDPERPMTEGASKVTGIVDSMLQGMPLIQDTLVPFSEFCLDTLIVAHNAPFDYQFLTADIQKHETPAPRGIVLDTCAMARKVFPGLINYKLGTLVQHLHIESTGFHRAEEDASYCGQLFWKMIEKLTVNGQPPTIETLIELSGGKTLLFPQIEKQPKQMNLLDL